jgi:hypothetical protein
MRYSLVSMLQILFAVRFFVIFVNSEKMRLNPYTIIIHLVFWKGGLDQYRLGINYKRTKAHSLNAPEIGGQLDFILYRF